MDWDDLNNRYRAGSGQLNNIVSHYYTVCPSVFKNRKALPSSYVVILSIVFLKGENGREGYWD